MGPSKTINFCFVQLWKQAYLASCYSGEGGNAGNGEDAKYKSMGKHQDAGGGGFVTMECKFTLTTLYLYHNKNNLLVNVPKK